VGFNGLATCFSPRVDGAKDSLLYQYEPTSRGATEEVICQVFRREYCGSGPCKRNKGLEMNVIGQGARIFWMQRECAARHTVELD